jgi:hypothetical protein
MPTSDNLTREAVKVGFIAGVNVDVSLTPQNFLYFSTGLSAKYLQGDFRLMHKYGSPIDSTVSTVRTYRTMYLTIPTGIKFRTPPSKNCVFTGQLGLYHNFRIGGKQFDNFVQSPEFFTTTQKIKNQDAALFAEAGYFGIGFEYEFAPNIRVFSNANYSCQFNYFSIKATNNITNEQFKSIVHSMHIVFGILF